MVWIKVFPWDKTEQCRYPCFCLSICMAPPKKNTKTFVRCNIKKERKQIFLGAFAQSRKPSISFVICIVLSVILPVCAQESVLLPLHEFSVKFCTRELVRTSVEKSQIWLNWTKISDNLHEDISTMHCCQQQICLWKHFWVTLNILHCWQWHYLNKTHRPYSCIFVAIMVLAPTTMLHVTHTQPGSLFKI